MKIDNELIEWIRGSNQWAIMKQNPSNYKLESDFIRKYFPTDGKINFGLFGELLVKKLLETPTLPISHQVKLGKFRMDLANKNAIYEVKTRSYSMSGTAGEKILFPLIKYSEIATLEKPIIVVLVGYQEFEAKYKFKLFNEENSNFFKLCQDSNIFYILASDLL